MSLNWAVDTFNLVDVMRQSCSWISSLIIVLFLTGIVAPLPECYVTRVFCPLANATESLPLPQKVDCPSANSACCDKQKGDRPVHSKCSMETRKTWMKSYTPQFETAEAPEILIALVPIYFSEPAFPRRMIVFISPQTYLAIPDTIPILLQKQSLLI